MGVSNGGGYASLLGAASNVAILSSQSCPGGGSPGIGAVGVGLGPAKTTVLAKSVYTIVTAMRKIRNVAVNKIFFFIVPMIGFEPIHLAARGFESLVSSSFTTPAKAVSKRIELSSIP